MFGIKLNNTAKSAPISSHRAFPAVVALWFAALLGLGSLIVPVILFETLATSSGISSVIPAAAPPLGTTARLAIAAVAAIIGAAAGIFIARKVAAAQSPAPTDRSAKFVNNDDASDHNQKRPISAREELGSDYLDEPIADVDQSTNSFGGGRRRSLAVTDESGPSEFLETVPLPGGDIVFDAPSDDVHEDALHDDPVGHVEDDLVDDDGPLVLGDLDLTEAVSDTDASNTDRPEAAFLSQADDMASSIPADVSNTESAADVQTFNEPANQVAAEQPAQLSPREELAAMTNRFANPSPITAADDTRPFAQPQEAAQALETDAAMSGNSPVSDRALDELGMVELVERFALALQNQKAQQTAATATTEEPVSAAPYNPFGANIPDAADIQPPVFRRSNPAPATPEPLTLDTVATEPAAAATAPAEPSFAEAAMGKVPSGMKPFGFDDFDDEEDEDSFSDVSDLGLSLSVPSAPFGQPDQHEVPAAPEPVGAESAEQEEVADDFSSLLAMKSSLGNNHEFVRVDADLDTPTPADPGVVFPGQTDNTAASSGGKKPSIAFPEPEPAPAPRAFDAPPGMQPQSRQSNNGETERALKEALEKLQKMSGAA